jgi:NAD(P)-dependent dehydrogenase (short-subunit alcohol dehydrogenase family)
MAVVLVIGASRGLGLEFVRQFTEAGDRVIATVRDAAGRVQALGAEVLTVDASQPASVSGLAWQLDGEKIDTALYVAGVYACGTALSPPTRELFDDLRATLCMLTAAHKGQFLHHDGSRFAGW